MRTKKKNCSYEKNNVFYSRHEVKPVIEYCQKCRTLFFVKENGDRDEVLCSIEELNKFLEKKNKQNGYTDK